MKYYKVGIFGFSLLKAIIKNIHYKKDKTLI